MVCSLLGCVDCAAAQSAPQTGAEAFILMDAGSGRVLTGKNTEQELAIASTTKIMTALVALETGNLSDKVTVKQNHLKEGSSMYLKAGERYTVEDLLYGLMLVSGNDAALALAIHTAGSVEGFARLMNEKARELGMTGSHFENPHGLDAEGHYSTARDMAVLAAHCMANEDFARIVSTRHAVVAGQDIYNHNKLLGMYDGCIGVKTGYTMAAGRTLVTCAERDGARYICVTLCDRDDWADHASLYDWAFENYEYVKAVDSGTLFRVSAVNGGGQYAPVRAEHDGFVLLDAGAEYEVRLELPPFVVCPVREGESAGRAIVTSGGETVCEVPLVYAGDMPAANGGSGIWGRISDFFSNLGSPLYLTEEET